MSRYQLVAKLPANDELQSITGFANGSTVELHCDFEYWNKAESKGFLFHSVQFYGMNPNGADVSICSDELYNEIMQACIDQLRAREEQAYREYLKQTA